MKHLWVVEMLLRDAWHPTVGAALNREDAQREMTEWKRCNPEDRFRICRYGDLEEAAEVLDELCLDRDTLAARLCEADAALDKYRICSDADGVRIRELVDERDALAERCRRLGAKLKVVQWYQPLYNGRPSCPDCQNFYEDGHAPDCGLAALLKEMP